MRISVPFSTRSAGSSQDDRSSGGSSRRRVSPLTRLIARLVVAWVVLLALILVGAGFLTSRSKMNEESNHGAAAPPVTNGGEAQDATRLHNAQSECQEVFFNYLNAVTPEERAQFVANPLDTVGRMNRFAENHNLPRVDPANLTMGAGGFLKIPGKEAVEIRWTGHPDTLIDCVFFKGEAGWLLDWDHFARFQPEVWSLFCTEQGVREAEFRLLVRERVMRESANDTDLALVFASPRFGMPQEAGQPQARLNILRNSPDGKLLSAAFRLRRAGKAPFESTLAPVDDEDMIRVRAVLRRTDQRDDEGDRLFELVAIKACHWLDLDDPGVTVAAESTPETADPP